MGKIKANEETDRYVLRLLQDPDALEEIIRQDAQLSSRHRNQRFRSTTQSVNKSRGANIFTPDRVAVTDQFEAARLAEEASQEAARLAAENREAAARLAVDARRAFLRNLRYPVFRRDGWLCWLCGYQTKKSDKIYGSGLEMVMSEPLAPTLDHVIPVEDNGPDTVDNLRCAHRYCNTARGTLTPREAWSRLHDWAARIDPKLDAYQNAPARFWRPEAHAGFLVAGGR